MASVRGTADVTPAGVAAEGGQGPAEGRSQGKALRARSIA